MAFFKTIAELNAHVHFSVTFDLDTILPLLDRDCRAYTEEILGAAQYISLHTAYNDGSLDGLPETDINVQLLREVQATEARLASWLSLDDNLIVRDSTGPTVGSTDKLKPASQYRIEKARASAMAKAFVQIDRLLAFLETNAGNYPLWTAAQQAILKDLLISTTGEFQRYYEINNSRYLFSKMNATMRRTQRSVIRPLLGDDAYAEMQTEYSTVVSGDYVTLIPLAQEILALSTIAKAIPSMAITMSEKGITLYQNERNESLETYQPSPTNRLYVLVKDAEQDASGVITDFVKERDKLAGAGNLPTYVSAGLYDADEDDNDATRNDGDGSIWNGL